jgi:hypothetical protein
LIEILKDPNLSANIDWDGLAAKLSTETISCTVGGLKKRNFNRLLPTSEETLTSAIDISRMKIAARDDNGYALNYKYTSNYIDLHARQRRL